MLLARTAMKKYNPHFHPGLPIAVDMCRFAALPSQRCIVPVAFVEVGPRFLLRPHSGTGQPPRWPSG